MITWDIVLLTIGFTLFVVLFLGPAMWSSDTEFLIVRLWRLYRQRTRRKELPEATPHAPETADGAPPSGDPPQL